MVKVNEIQSTATFAWSNDAIPLLATGTAAGVIDDNFSSLSTLSFYSLYENQPILSVDADAKFHDLDWSKSNNLLAGALENGVIQFWNTENLSSKNTVYAVAKGESHSGLIKSLQFNPIQHNILASGGANGEIFVWDTSKLTNLSPFTPGSAMTPMDTVNSISWNNTVSHIFASAGTAGYTSIWDLKAKKEVLHLTYTSPSGSRANLTTVAWHPTQSTKLLTASESDGVPVILTWDLRNSNAPESILSGHKKGVLSVDWNARDPSLLLSSGKDNTTILWNPLTSEKLAQYPTTANWAFKTRFAPTTPDYFATASFDKKIVIQSLQDTSPPVSNRINSTSETDFWNKISDTETQQPEYFIKQAPNWYGRPSSVSFGFGGKIVKVAKAGEKTSEIIIEKASLPGSKENDSLSKALESEDFKEIIEEHIKNAIDDTNKSDWELLQDLSGNEDVFSKFIAFSINGDSTKTADGEDDAAKDGADFFTNYDEEPKYLPSGEFKFSEASKDLSDALLTKNLSKAVDISLKEGKLTEALVISLNGPKDLKQKVLDYYLNKNAAKDSVARLLYSVSSNDVQDLVENGDVTSWREIATAIKTYSTNEEIYKTYFTKLGDRILEADPVKNRGNAIKTYINASSLDKVASIWVSEMKSLETKILSSKKTSAYDAHFESLSEFVEKFSAYRSTLKLDADITDSESLLSTILEFTNIISTNGQFELANKFLSLLSDENPEVKLEKERIAKASGISTTARIASARKAHPAASRYGDLSASSSSMPPITPSVARGRPSNPYLPPQPAAASLPTPQTTQVNPYGTPVSTNPYVAPSANPYKPAPVANPYKPVAPAPITEQSNPLPPPPKNGKKHETQGWNDLPSHFHQHPRRATPAAAVSASKPALIPPVNGFSPPPATTSVPPQISRNSSFVNPPSIPPPPRSVSKTRKSTPASPEVKQAVPTTNSRYAPTAQASPALSSPSLRNSGFDAPPISSKQPVTAPPQQWTKNPYAPTAPSPSEIVVNPYAPPAAAVSPAPQIANPYAPTRQSSHPVQTSNPYAPPPTHAHAAPPQQFGAPPVSQFIPPPHQQSQNVTLPPQSIALETEQPKTKYPAGDRSHIPDEQQKIFNVLSEEFARVKPDIPEKYTKQVQDTEKRLNILFDHLNNEDLLTQPSLELLNNLVDALSAKDFETALGYHVELATNHTQEGGNWLVGIKRLIQFSEAVS